MFLSASTGIFKGVRFKDPRDKAVNKTKRIVRRYIKEDTEKDIDRQCNKLRSENTERM